MEKKLIAIALIAAVLASCRIGGNPAATAGEAAGEAAALDELVTDRENHPMTPVPKPEPGGSFVDPEFGTRITRVTDADPGEVIKPMYSTIQAWNCDESLLILYRTSETAGSSGHYLYDGQSYAFLRELDINPTDLEHVVWSTSDPDILYFPESLMEGPAYVNRLIEYRVSTGARRVVRDFAARDGISGYLFGFGGDPQFSSWDNRFFGFLAPENDPVRYGIYDRENDSVAMLSGEGSGGVAPMPGPSGRTFYLGGKVLDSSMNELLTLAMANPEEHASIGRLPNGHDAIFMAEFDGSDPGTLISYDMETGARRALIAESLGYPYPPHGTHVCALAFRAPNLIGVSVVGYDADGQTLLDNEILVVDSSDGTVARVCHHRSRAQAPNNEGPMGYWAEPHVVISPSGTRLLFGSDWEGGASVDSYVVELPTR